MINLNEKKQTGSTWQNNHSVTSRFSDLSGEIDVGVLIVGGGLTGIISAYLLNKEGFSVALVEKDTIASGASSYSTAFATQSVDTKYFDIAQNLGDKAASLVYESHSSAIETLEAIIGQENIECEWVRCPSFTYATSKKDVDILTRELEIAKELDLSINGIHESGPYFHHHGSISFNNQAKFHPIKFISGLTEKLRNEGVKIYERTEVLAIEGEGPFEAVTEKGKVRAGHVLSATHIPLNNNPRLFFSKGSYVTYVLEATIPARFLKEGIYEDTFTPYHYFRVDEFQSRAYDRLIIGGSDHRHELAIEPDKNWRAIEDHIQTILPKMPYKIKRRWMGPIVEPVDGLAYIGRHTDNIFYATGFSGNGVTYAVITALMFRDDLLGYENEWKKVYDLSRIPTLRSLLSKGKEYASIFFGGAVRNLFKY
jgi:glycine/D-amino acid oxidase-like deaminating enzyme